MGHFSETNLACLHRRQTFMPGFLQDDMSASNIGARLLRQYYHLLLNESVIPTYQGDLRALQGLLTSLVPVAEPMLRAAPALALFMQTAALPEMQRDLALHSNATADGVYGRSAAVPAPVAAQTRALRDYCRAHMCFLNHRVETELFRVPFPEGTTGGGGPRVDRAAADLRQMQPPQPYVAASQTPCGPLLVQEPAPAQVPHPLDPQPAASEEVGAPALAAAGAAVDQALCAAIPKFHYRSLEQQQLVHAAAVGANVMAVLRTGAGKTMAVVGCMLAGLPRIAGQQQRKLVVLLVPLLALKQAAARSLRRYFKSGGADEVVAWAPIPCLKDGLSDLARVIVVTVEDLVHPGFGDYFAGRVSVLFVDEAHWLVDGQAFRPDYPYAASPIRSLGCPIVCMTATASPKTREEILKLLSLDRGVLTVVQSCQRTDMVYRVAKLPPVGDGGGGEVGAFVRLVLATWDEPEWRSRRILIYCLKKDSCTEVADRLGSQMALRPSDAGAVVGLYVGGGEDNSATLAEFTASGSPMRALVGTDSIGCGLDVPDIGIVFHYGAGATSVERFLQQTGRAGRSGRPGEVGLSVVCHVLSEVSAVAKAIDKQGPDGGGSISGCVGGEHRRSDSAAALKIVKEYMSLVAPACRQQWLAQQMGEERPELQACAELCKVTPLCKSRCDLCCAAPVVAANSAAGAAFTAAQATAAAICFRSAFREAETALLGSNCFHCSLETGASRGPCQKQHTRWPSSRCLQCCSTTHHGIRECRLFEPERNRGRCYSCLRPMAGPMGSWTCNRACNGTYAKLRAIGMAVRVLEWAVAEGASSSGDAAAAFIADVKMAAGAAAFAMAEAAARGKKRAAPGASAAELMDEKQWVPIAELLLRPARDEAKEVCRAQVLVWLAYRRTTTTGHGGGPFDYRALL